jgi:hypothetical protein
MPVKRLFVLLVLALSLALGAATSAPAANPEANARPVAVLKPCSSRYKHAVIAGEHKCLGTGQFCARRYEAVYRRHGFTCKPGSDGRLRLHRS